MPSILIAGYFGFGNLGDEAILAGMLRDLRVRVPQLDATVLSGDPAKTTAAHGVAALPWTDVPAIIAGVQGADLVILGGGGLFHDYWGADASRLMRAGHAGLAYYCSIPLLAAAAEKPVMIYAAGVGPLRHESGRALTRMAFECADYATVRDTESRHALRAIGEFGSRLRVTADPSFSLPAASPHPQEAIIAVCLRNWDIEADPARWQSAVAEGLDRFAQAHDVRYVFVPFQRLPVSPLTQDAEIAVRLKEHMREGDRVEILDRVLSPDEMVEWFAPCRLVVGMRFHSVVLAALAGVPAVALVYDPKVEALARSLGLGEFALSLSALTESALFASLSQVWSLQEELRRRVVERTGKLRRRSQMSADLALDLLHRGRRPSSLATRYVSQFALDRARELFRIEAGAHEHEETLRREIEAFAAETSQLRTRVREAEAGLESLTRAGAEERARHQAEASQLRQWAKEHEAQLESITRSTGWALLQLLWRTRRAVIPRGTTRERIAVECLRIARRLLRRPLQRSGAAADTSGAAPIAPQVPVPTKPSGSPTVVNILAPLFFDQDGEEMMRGGAERYVLQLAPLIERRGYEVRVYQSARSAWQRSYGGVRVYGIDTGGDVGRLNQVFHEQVEPGALTLYLAFHLAAPRAHPRSIGISHGIFWDDPGFQRQESVLREKVVEVLTAIANLAALVSVDSATINWVRSTRLGLADRITFIPNFVDCGQFMPQPRGSAQRLVVLYPRRMYRPRGFWLVAEILPHVLARHAEVEVHFVGPADVAEAEAVRSLIAQFPTNVRWYSLEPERMHEAYQRADITLIPTTFAEGTSLSCLEAQACANAVIATHVGGLPDLVHHGYNGLLIPPTADALQSALELLIADERLRKELGQHAAEVAQRFNLPIWEERWNTVLDRYLPVLELPARPPHPVALIPEASGVQWGRMKQRPHHIAEQLVRAGMEVFWFEADTPSSSPVPGLHIGPSPDVSVMERPVVLVYFPYLSERLREFRHPLVIYDVLDDISIYQDSDDRGAVPPGRRARDFYRYLLTRADIVVASSRKLHAEVVRRRPDALYVPNGVDVDTFDLRRDHNGVPPEIARLRRPVIGFHGALGPWFDFELVEWVSRARPDYQFVLIGPVTDEGRLRQLLRRCRNAHYLTERRFEDLPAYVAAYDVAMVPFRIDEVTRATRPLKVLECLAMGKHVVASAMPEIADWPGVYVAHTPDEFADALDRALQQDGRAAQVSELASFARSSSWETAVAPLVQAIRREYHAHDAEVG